MIEGSALLGLLLQIVVVGLIVYLLLWGLGQIGVPEPYNKVARVLIIVFSVLWLINILLRIGGHALVRW